jgi:predicted aspartyl protease
MISVKTLGKQRPFIVDTGAGCCVFDDRLALQMKEVGTRRVATAGGSVELKAFRQPEISFGQITSPGGGVSLALDLAGAKEAVGRDVSGILGMTVIEQHVMRLSADRQRLEFFDSVPADPGQSFELGRSGKVYTAKLTIAGSHVEECVIDTGSLCELSLREPLFDFLEDFGSIKRIRTVSFATANGVVMKKEGILDSLTLGGWTHKNLVVSESGHKQSHIGLSYLSRFEVTLDPFGNRLFLKPGKMFSEKSRRSCLGTGLRNLNGNVAVCSIDANGPAAKAGLKDGDIIESLDGEDVDGTDVMRLRRLFTNDGQVIRLGVRRGARFETLQIRLSDY